MLTFAFALCTCNGAAPDSAPQTAWVVTLEPPASIEAADPISALKIGAQGSERVPSELILVEGEPSTVSVAKYREGETTETLLERTVPIETEVQPDHLVVRPRNVLTTGQRYTLLAREGIIGSVRVGLQESRGYLTRVWPPVDSNAAAVQAIYCGQSAPMGPMTIRLFPGDQRAMLEAGLNQSGLATGVCIRIVPEISSGRLVQPPVRIGDYSLQPTPLYAGMESTEPTAAVCTDGEVGFAAGCLKITTGRAVVRAPGGPTFWAISRTSGWHAEFVEAGAEFAIPIQQEMQAFWLEATVFDISGRSQSATVQLAPPQPSPRVVINEVMANPQGPEPQQEWVELLNDGMLTAEMLGWTLSDGTIETEIPPTSMAPSAFALLVRSDYDAGLSGDIAPSPETALVRLPKLGQGGLLNSGETLTLRDDKDRIVSVFPARPSARPGVSIARRDSMTLDSDPDGFVPHAQPGASPGSPNLVE